MLSGSNLTGVTLKVIVSTTAGYQLCSVGVVITIKDYRSTASKVIIEDRNKVIVQSSDLTHLGAKWVE